MDTESAEGLIRVTEWALNRFTERQLAAATGVVVLVYFRGEMRELVRAAFARRSTRKRVEAVEAAVAKAQEQLARLERSQGEQTAILHRQDNQLDLVIQLLRAPRG